VKYAFLWFVGPVPTNQEHDPALQGLASLQMTITLNTEFQIVKDLLLM